MQHSRGFHVRTGFRSGWHACVLHGGSRRHLERCHDHGRSQRHTSRRCCEHGRPGGEGATDEIVAPLFAHFLEYYAAHIAVHTRPFEGVVPALEAFRKDGWKLAVCTNKAEQLTLPLLEALDLTRYFDAVVGGDTFPVAKPHAEPVHGAIARAGGQIEGSIMVGDSVTDIDAARNAGIPVIAVDFGYTTIPVRELSPDRVISHFNELAEAVEALRKDKVSL